MIRWQQEIYNVKEMQEQDSRRRSNKSVMQVDEEEEEQGETWDSKVTFILATIGSVDCSRDVSPL